MDDGKDGWMSKKYSFGGRDKSERDGNRKKTENQKTDGGRTRRGDKWREAAGRKMEEQTKGKMKRRK